MTAGPGADTAPLPFPGGASTVAVRKHREPVLDSMLGVEC